MDYMDTVIGLYNYGTRYPYYSRIVYNLLSLFLKEAGEPSHDRSFDLEGFYKSIIIHGDALKIKSLVNNKDKSEREKMDELMIIGIEARKREQYSFIHKHGNILNFLNQE
jgi:hypothetical protein